MSKLPEPYRICDAEIKLLNKQMLRIAEKAKKKLNIQNFDELNVMEVVDAMYTELSTDAHKRIKELYVEKCGELYTYLQAEGFKMRDYEDSIDELIEMWMVGLLEVPNPTTTYIYEMEVYRKRDRAKESINAVKGKSAKLSEIDKAIRIWSRMNGWYMILASQDAEIQMYKECGVKKVQRHEMNDDRTCDDCMAEDGAIYDVDKIPDTHPGCRRWFTPVK